MVKNSSLLLDIGPGLSMLIGIPTISTWETNKRPKKPARGMFGFNQKTNSLEYYNGSYWLAATMSEA